MGVGGHIPVYDAFTDITTIALAGFCCFFAYACIVSLILSHRVAGPMTAIIACIEEYGQGNYDFKRELRGNDELEPIHDALQDLGRALKDQQRSR